jgi:hypothetical protein
MIEETEKLRILKYSGENVKRLKFAELNPDENFVVVAGNNAQGKTSLLDSIMMALGGGDKLGPRPIHDGEGSATVELDFGKFKVTRKITGGGTRLVIEGANGERFDKPQTLLDELVGKISFDPLEFANMKAADQITTLKELAGLDFDKLNAERKEKYGVRTALNADLRRESTIAAGMHRFPDAKPVDVEEILKDQRKAQEHNQAVEARAVQVKQLEQVAKSLKDDENRIAGEIERIKQSLKNKEEELAKKQADYKLKIEEAADAHAKIKDDEKIDLDVFANKMTEAKEANDKVAANEQWEAQNKKVNELKKETKALSDRIAEIDKEKAEIVANAKFPIPEISFDDERGVMYEGREFANASDAQRLKASVSIGVALHPKMPIILVRHGSDLDTNNLRMLHQLAIEKDAQIWVERVGEEGPASVIIEDGLVKEEKTLKI